MEFRICQSTGSRTKLGCAEWWARLRILWLQRPMGTCKARSEECISCSRVPAAAVIGCRPVRRQEESGLVWCKGFRNSSRQDQCDEAWASGKEQVTAGAHQERSCALRCAGRRTRRQTMAKHRIALPTSSPPAPSSCLPYQRECPLILQTIESNPSAPALR
jgi:hypothetical protein